MKKISLLIVILIIFALQLNGCATTHFVPSQCPTIEPPPELAATDWVKIVFIDQGEEVIYFALPQGKIDRANLKLELLEEYARRCHDLNKKDGGAPAK